jgi:hypothetical protein
MAMPAMADDTPRAGVISVPNSIFGDGPLSLSVPQGRLGFVPLQGPVQIDWHVVETTADNPSGDKISRGIARMLLAVRDGAWVAMEGGKP